MRVELRKWSMGDKNALMRICNEVDRRYLSDRIPYPYTEDDADWWLGMAEEHEGKDGIFRAVVADGEVVGNISVEKKTDIYGKDAEIGYFLDSSKWSKGIMTEAVKAICEISFEELDIIRITGLVFEPNQASQKVLLKNDFVLEGIMRNAVNKDGEICDLCIYGKCC